MLSHDLKITDTYARSGGKMATFGAASIVIENIFDKKDRFIEAAKKVALHTDFEGAKCYCKNLLC